MRKRRRQNIASRQRDATDTIAENELWKVPSNARTDRVRQLRLLANSGEHDSCMAKMVVRNWELEFVRVIRRYVYVAFATFESLRCTAGRQYVSTMSWPLLSLAALFHQALAPSLNSLWQVLVSTALEYGDK